MKSVRGIFVNVPSRALIEKMAEPVNGSISWRYKINRCLFTFAISREREMFKEVIKFSTKGKTRENKQVSFCKVSIRVEKFDQRRNN